MAETNVPEHITDHIDGPQDGDGPDDVEVKQDGTSK
jgi:hypothetical protein